MLDAQLKCSYIVVGRSPLITVAHGLLLSVLCCWRIFVGRFSSTSHPTLFQTMYLKIPIISPGCPSLLYVQKAFSLGLFSGELISGGAHYWREFCVSQWVGCFRALPSVTPLATIRAHQPIKTLNGGRCETSCKNHCTV